MRLRGIFGIFLCLVTITIGSMPTANAAELVCPMGIAHKGNAYSGGPSENSINGFTTAFNVGSQWVETDVHFTSDSVPVLMHNATVDDATDGTGAIANMTAAQFTSLHLADGQHPPTLDQLMTLILASPSRHLLLEMKATTITTAQEQILLQKLQGHEDQVHIMAFANRFPTVQHLKAADPAFTASILGYDPILPPPAGIASEDLEYTYITAARVNQLHALGLKVKAWTPDNATAWASMRQMGVDVIITNKVRDYINWAKTTCPTQPAPTAPNVSMNTPVSNELRGTETISATASDAVSISSVQFQLDGANLGGADTAAPYTFDWDTTTATYGVHSLRAVATNNSGLQTISSPVSLTVNNAPLPPTAPTVSIQNPIAGSTLRGIESVSADASDAASVSSVQFQLDDTDLGIPITSAPYALDLDTTLVSDGAHTLRAIATNEFGLQTTSLGVPITVNNSIVAPPTAPTVSVSAPIAGATLNGVQMITADASDDVAVNSVQFQLDGVNLGAADTTAPYSTSWDTTTVANGTHVLRAIATNDSGLQTISSEVSVNVNNVVAPPATKEFVTNASFETDLNGWTGLWSTNSKSTRIAGGYGGGYALRSVNTAVAPTQHGFTSKPETLDGTTNATVAGKVYTGTVWVKPDVTNQKINLYVRERDAAGNTVSSKTITVTTKNLNWQQLTNVYTAAGTGNRISITVWATSSAQNQGFLADMLSFTALN